MKLAMHQIDAFTDRVFGGNPAAVCPLEAWLPEDVMQSIAAENNLAETAFFVREGDGFRLRWFTPVDEVDLCGHATLASADVIFRILGYQGSSVRFETRSGLLVVRRLDSGYQMDFPAAKLSECEAPEALMRGLRCSPLRVWKAFDYIVEFDSEDAVLNLSPDMSALSELDLRGVCITAPGDACDFVSRFFAPRLGIPEDPVTGSVHCELGPLWSARLGKTVMEAIQVSARKGHVGVEVVGDRILLRGHAAHYMTAEIYFPG